MGDDSIKAYFDRLNLIYYAMIAAPMLIFGLVYLPIKEDVSFSGGAATVAVSLLIYTGVVLLMISPLLGIRLSRRYLHLIRTDWKLKAKLDQFRKASMINFSMIMGASLVASGLLFITKNQLFVVVYALLLFIVSFYRPTLERLCRHLPLTEEEMQMVKNQGQII